MRGRSAAAGANKDTDPIPIRPPALQQVMSGYDAKPGTIPGINVGKITPASREFLLPGEFLPLRIHRLWHRRPGQFRRGDLVYSGSPRQLVGAVLVGSM